MQLQKGHTQIFPSKQAQAVAWPKVSKLLTHRNHIHHQLTTDFEYNSESSAYSHTSGSFWTIGKETDPNYHLREEEEQMQVGRGSSHKRAIPDLPETQQELNVINLSSQPLSDTCLTALSKWLSFVPTTHCRDFDTTVDFHTYFQTLRLK